MANSAPTTVIRNTAKAMMKLLIRRPCSRRRAAVPALAADGAARGRMALHQTALTLPFGRAFLAKPALARLPLAFARDYHTVARKFGPGFCRLRGHPSAVGRWHWPIAGQCPVG